MAVVQARGTKSSRRTRRGPAQLRLTQNAAGVEPKPATADRTAFEAAQVERRTGERVKARGQGVATFIDPDGRLWLTRVTLVDRSVDGIGIRCPVRVTPGASFRCSVDGRIDSGSVAHTRGRGGAYRVGLRCERRMAA